MDKRDGINRKIMKKYLKDYFIYNIKYNANSRNPIKIEKDRDYFRVLAKRYVNTGIFDNYFSCFLYSNTKNWDMYTFKYDSKECANLLNLFTLSSIYLPYNQRTNYQLF